MITVKKGNTVTEGVDNMITAMLADYDRWVLSRDSDKEGWANRSYDTKMGKKYIKITSENGGVVAFVVNTDQDSKFKLGDVLMAASFSAPARNKARGNVLEGNFQIEWTGALYLR